MKRYSLLLLVLVTGWSCGDDDQPNVNNQDNFDRSAMLENWADNIIVPAYESYVQELGALSNSANQFVENKSVDNLNALREQWLTSYLAWQRVSMFEIGQAEALTLRDFTNIFPTDTDGITENINSGDYNLELSSTRDEQGFPALDYLLYGTGTTAEEIVTVFAANNNYDTYLTDVIDRLNSLANDVLEDWTNGYRDTFVNNDGSDANSSVNKLANDFLFYYEKALRAGKIGIPAGVFSNTPLGDRVEGLYSRIHSKDLYETALEAVVNFFNGQHFDGNGTGDSFAAYLTFLNSITEGEDLGALINNQFQETILTSSQLRNDLFEEVETNNQAMLATYDELQANVVLMKVDMFQAMNIRVDFVDADGD